VSEIKQENKILSFLKKVAGKLLDFLVWILKLLYKLLKLIWKGLKKLGAKLKAFGKKQLAKFRKAIAEKKCGRPLKIEFLWYVLKEAGKGFYKGGKEGKILYRLRREMKKDCDQ
jgi:hypothetical protein